LAARYGVTSSWVVATILADALGIKEQPDFAEIEGVKSRTRGAA
jgi:hypothetical protein